MEGAGVQCLRSLPTKDPGKGFVPNQEGSERRGAEVRYQVTVRKEGLVRGDGRLGALPPLPSSPSAGLARSQPPWGR